MKKQFEQYKKLYITTIDFLMLLLPALFFWILWSREINELLYVDFKNKGNWLIVIFYVIVLAIMLHTFRGFKIGYYKIASLLISRPRAVI